MTDNATRKITCPRYERSGDGRRCVHYRKGGGCARPGGSEAVCEEWLKVNGAPAPPNDKPDPRSAPEPHLDLFGNPTQPSTPRRGSSRPPVTKSTSPASSPTAPPKPPLVRNVTDEEVASFKELGAEICIRSAEVGELWLVPEYTDADRQELSVEHSITLTTICASFPGAKVVSIKRA